MSLQYSAIGWNRQKKVYDVTLLSLLVLYLGTFVGVGVWRNPSATAETLVIRAFGTAAFLLLNVVLCIGPLTRLDRPFLCGAVRQAVRQTSHWHRARYDGPSLSV